MNSLVRIVAMAAVLFATSAAALADCVTCEVNKAKGGWCDTCKAGYFDGVKLTSKKLYDALQPKTVDAAALKCDGCKKALAAGGMCDKCKIGYSDKKAYASPVAYKLAAGAATDVAKIECPTCKRNAINYGWCAKCKVGMIGSAAFKDRAKFDDALKTRQTLQTAAVTKCDGCAVAMVTDGTCATCKITYKAGRREGEEPDKPEKGGNDE